MSQQPDGPADILTRLRVASRNGIATDTCDHAIAEIERLQAELAAANARFAEMSTPTGREIELQEILSEALSLCDACKCEHGVPDGYWCEPCNHEHKLPAAEAEASEKARAGR